MSLGETTREIMQILSFKQRTMTMKSRYYTLLALGLMALGACNKEEVRQDGGEGQSVIVSITGSVKLPEWVDLDHEGEEGALRAFTLRPDDQGFPKIRLSGIEDRGLSYEPFPSSVWLYSTTGAWDGRIDVDDNQENPNRQNTNLSGTNRSNGSSAATRGVSRIIKKGDAYHVLISYEASGKQGQPSYLPEANRQQYPNYQQGSTRVFVAFGHHYTAQTGHSLHRLYMPRPHQTGETSTPPTLDPLKHTLGDFVVAESSAVRRHGQTTFKIPLISNYANLSTVASPTAAGTETQFHMPGALLALKFDNRTGADITIKKVHTRSNNLAYSGYYELWNGHNAKAGDKYTNNIPSGVASTPFFARDNVTGDNKRSHVYTADVQDEQGGAYSLAAGAKSQGRFYLWGAIDQSKSTSVGNTTLLQVEYSYNDDLNAVYYSEAINIAPKTAPNKFEEGKAYLITVPVNKPRLNYPLFVVGELNRVNAQDFPSNP